MLLMTVTSSLGCESPNAEVTTCIVREASVFCEAGDDILGRRSRKVEREELPAAEGRRGRREGGAWEALGTVSLGPSVGPPSRSRRLRCALHDTRSRRTQAGLLSE